jgi:hypothetical protein
LKQITLAQSNPIFDIVSALLESRGVVWTFKSIPPSSAGNDALPFFFYPVVS